MYLLSPYIIGGMKIKKFNYVTFILIVFVLLLIPLQCVFAEEEQQATTNNHLEVEAFQSNEGISMDIDIPFASDNLNIQDVIFNKKDISKFEDTMTLKPGQKVPQGIYNIQVKAYDDFNSYILFKRDYDFNSKTNTITFTKDEVSHLSIVMENNDLILRGLSLIPKNWKSYNMTHLYNNSKSVYISKMEYESLWSSFKTYDRYALDYNTFNISGYEDTTLNFNTNIKANLNFEYKSTYLPGEKIAYYNDFLVLKDDFNNRILFATDPEYNHINGSLIFTDETQTFTVPVEENLAYPEITLPCNKGTFNVNYENNDIPAQVTSNQSSITIK